MIKPLLRIIWKITKWTFLLTLPVTLVPMFTAAINGILLSIWMSAQVDASTEKLLYSVKDAMGDWGIGGGVPSFRQFQDTHNDFHTMRINFDDLNQKLGFIVPEQYHDEDGVIKTDLPIDKFADIENLVRNVSPTANCGEPEKPREQWVYLTGHGFRFFPWDEDFAYAINYAQGDRKLNQTGMYFAQCSGTAGFLCGVWNTRTPALVHFLVEDEPLDADELAKSGLSYAGQHEDLRPVTVRIIEFPLKEAYTGLPWTTFPSHQNQMLSIMTGDRLYEQFDLYHPMAQSMRRFFEYMDKTYLNNEHHFLHRVDVLETWMEDHITKPLGIQSGVNMLQFLVLALTTNVGTVLLEAWKLVNMVVGLFLGKPLRGDEILGDLGKEYSGEPANIMDDIFGGFVDHVFGGDMLAGIDKMSSKSVRDSVSATGTGTTAATT